MGLFTNGNARVTKLIIIQLGLASLSMVLIQVLGFLPSLDFLTPRQLKITCFALSVALSCNKAGELFFNKTASLLKSYSPDKAPEIPAVSGSTDLITKP